MEQWGVPSWHALAACYKHPNPDIFFPDTGAAGVVQASAAKSVCSSCEVRPVCLADALADRPSKDWGIRGGTTENEREDMRKGRRKIPDAARLAALAMIEIGDQDGTGRAS